MAPSITILFIEKSGNIKELTVKEVIPGELYKKASYKSADGFDIQATWKTGKHKIRLYARKTGRAGSENKYDFPPPIDSTLLFGGCVLTCQDTNTDEYCSLSKAKWTKIYEELFGGFEDLGEEDSDTESESSESEVDITPKTKDGYKKDGFIVSDSEEDSEIDSDEESEMDSDEDIDELESDAGSDEDLVDELESDVESVIDSDEEEDIENYNSDGEPIVVKKKSTSGGKNNATIATSKKRTSTVTKKGVQISHKPVVPTVGASTDSISVKVSNKKTTKKIKPMLVSEPESTTYLNCSDELEEEPYEEV